MALFSSFCVAGRMSIIQSQAFRLPYLQARCVVLKTSSVEPPKLLQHDEKNELLGRPMSPHLTIYRPQLTSLLSVSHRASGIVLSGYAIILAGASFLSSDMASIASAIQGWHLPFLITFPLKFGLAVPASYHLSNGIRHLSWDLGKGLTLKEIYITGYMMLTSTFLLALYMALH